MNQYHNQNLPVNQQQGQLPQQQNHQPSALASLVQDFKELTDNFLKIGNTSEDHIRQGEGVVFLIKDMEHFTGTFMNSNIQTRMTRFTLVAQQLTAAFNNPQKAMREKEMAQILIGKPFLFTARHTKAKNPAEQRNAGGTRSVILAGDPGIGDILGIEFIKEEVEKGNTIPRKFKRFFIKKVPGSRPVPDLEMSGVAGNTPPATNQNIQRNNNVQTNQGQGVPPAGQQVTNTQQQPPAGLNNQNDEAWLKNFTGGGVGGQQQQTNQQGFPVI